MNQWQDRKATKWTWPIYYTPADFFRLRCTTARWLSSPARLTNTLLSMLDRLFPSSSTSAWPFYLNIEPTTLCNLSCPICPAIQSGSRELNNKSGKEKFLSVSLHNRLIKESRGRSAIISYSGNGEPLLHPNLPEMIRVSRQSGSFIFVTTSLQAPLEALKKVLSAKPDYLVISIHAANEEDMRILQPGASFTHLLKALEFISKLSKKDKPYIHLKGVMTSLLEGHVNEIYKLADIAGADKVSIKRMVLFNNTSEKAQNLIKNLIPSKKYTLNNTGSWKMYCDKARTQAVIMANGSVTPCVIDSMGSYILGDLQKKSMSEIWNGPKYRNFRRKSNGCPPELKICRFFCPLRRR